MVYYQLEMVWGHYGGSLGKGVSEDVPAFGSCDMDFFWDSYGGHSKPVCVVSILSARVCSLLM